MTQKLPHIRPLLIFSGKYSNEVILNREGVENTANLMEKAVSTTPGLGISSDEIIILKDSQFAPACDKIQEYFNSLKENDIALIYFCGHGFPDYEKNTVRLAFSDTTTSNKDEVAYDAKKIIEQLKRKHVKRYVIILDCCHSGFMMNMGEEESLVKLSPFETDGYVHISSTRSEEKCSEMNIEGVLYIPFSYFFAKALMGEYSTEKVLSINDVYSTVENKLTSAITYKAKCCIQRGNDFDSQKIFYIKQNSPENTDSVFSFSTFFQNSIPKLNVLLVKTSIKYPIKQDDFGIPLGLWMLKGEVSTNGQNINVDIYDERLELRKCNGNNEERKKVLENFKNKVSDYDIVCISLSSSSEVPQTLNKFKIAKEKNKITVAGGLFTSSNEKYLLDTNVIDYVIPGVGTTPFSNLLSHLCIDKKNGEYRTTHQLQGVASNQFYENYAVWTSYQLSTLRKAMWTEIFEMYKGFINDRMDVYTARGCNKNCLFCSVQRECGHTVLRKTEGEVIKEINFLKEQGIKYFSFKDEDFLSDPSRMLRILDAVKDSNVKFKIRARCDEMLCYTVNVDSLSKLGVNEIQYGLESPVSHIREAVHKGDSTMNTNDLMNFIKTHSDYGVTANCSFILGISDEDASYYKNLLSFINGIYDENSKPKIYVNFLTPHPYNSHIPTQSYKLISNDLNYYTHKFPVCCPVNGNFNSRNCMLETYDKIATITNSVEYNPTTADIPDELKNNFLRGKICDDTKIKKY